MSKSYIERTFLNTTRGQVVTLLRGSTHTVEELARTLELTDNAVRSHLTALERDGLVQQSGLRRSGGKPAYVYRLTPEAERLFPKPYALVLSQLLDVLSETTTPEENERHLREAGRRLAAAQVSPDANRATRLKMTVQLLNDLGGMAVLDERDGVDMIQGYSCPLVDVVPGHPQVCKLAEAMLTELMGAPVQENCDRTEPWHCSFRIPRS